ASVRGRWLGQQLAVTAAFLWFVRTYSGFYSRIIICFCSCPGREAVRGGLVLLSGMDHLGLARQGKPGNRGVASAASGVGAAGERRGGDKSASGGACDVDVPGESSGQDEVRRVSLCGTAANK